jgi:hypothetical protein
MAAGAALTPDNSRTPYTGRGNNFRLPPAPIYPARADIDSNPVELAPNPYIYPLPRL